MTMERSALLLAEYAEAGHTCRAQEQYVRASLSMYMVLAAAVVAFLATATLSTPGRAWVSFAAASIGFCMYLLIRRHQSIYSAHVTRARAIEAELQIALYSHVRDELSKIRGPSAKDLSALIVAIIAIAFVLGTLYFAGKAT